MNVHTMKLYTEKRNEPTILFFWMQCRGDDAIIHVKGGLFSFQIIIRSCKCDVMIDDGP